MYISFCAFNSKKVEIISTFYSKIVIYCAIIECNQSKFIMEIKQKNTELPCYIKKIKSNISYDLKNRVIRKFV